MTYRLLSYLGALAAIAGGAPRVISSFIPYEEGNIQLEIFYGLIDLCLLFGLLAVYLRVAERLGWLGFVGSVIAVTGLASIVGPDVTLWGVDLYQLGAAILMVGLASLAATMLWVGVMKYAALCWLAAFTAGIFSILSGSPFAFAVAGMLFGVGFVSAGVTLILEQEDVQA